MLNPSICAQSSVTSGRRCPWWGIVGIWRRGKQQQDKSQLKCLVLYAPSGEPPFSFNPPLHDLSSFDRLQHVVMQSPITQDRDELDDNEHPLLLPPHTKVITFISRVVALVQTLVVFVPLHSFALFKGRKVTHPITCFPPGDHRPTPWGQATHKVGQASEDIWSFWNDACGRHTRCKHGGFICLRNACMLMLAFWRCDCNQHGQRGRYLSQWWTAIFAAQACTLHWILCNFLCSTAKRISKGGQKGSKLMLDGSMPTL